MLDILGKIGFRKHKIVFNLDVFHLHILVIFNFYHTKMVLSNNSPHKYKQVGHELVWLMNKGLWTSYNESENKTLEILHYELVILWASFI